MKVAIVGAGRQGRRHALSIKQTGLGQIALVIDPDEHLASALAKEYGAQSVASMSQVLQSDVDAVVIASPVAAHHGAVIASIAAGKHVFCEKPLALDTIEASEMAKAAHEAGLILQCAFIMRHHPAMRLAKEWIDAGKLGALTYAHCEYARAKNFAKTWRADRSQSGGGNLHDQAIHVLDLFRWYMGEVVEGISYRSTAVWDMAPLEDDVSGLLRMKTGAAASFHVSYARWKPLFNFEIGGSDALIRIEGMGNPDYGTQKITLIARNDVTGLGDVQESIEFFDLDRPWNDEWREFYDSVKSSRKPLGDGTDGAIALGLVEMLYQSSTYAKIEKTL
ncbi:MAG TPA: Gfo/Idh/MocA family oxidoreductase [Patescibacteria group bacterium]|nr:Gfo/Idh/MocA family oxidoreductase [Patescibacteria group bacterium]